ncbi:MAG TPA: type II toxin-antitoxin system VapC family toxin [Terriglobales bacterium]|nr:type II toxin-antitoxin system VapC family toxin [Terriglobales bacterium]
MAVVVDASVAIKWVVEEPGTASAVKLRQGRLLAPDLLNAECANILWKKVRRGELDLDEAALAARLLQHSEIELRPTRPLLWQATEMACRLDHPAYDCMYLALAVAEDTAFVTADEHFLRVLATRPNPWRQRAFGLGAIGG